MPGITEHGPKNARSRRIASRVLFFPLTRIIIGCVVCAAVPLIFNALLRFVFVPEIFGEETARMARAGLFCTASLLTYCALFSLYEARKVVELSPKHLPREALFGLGGGALFISAVILILSFTGYYEVLSVNASLYNFFYLFIVISSLATFEEIIFRGIGYRIVEKWLGTNLALIVTGLLFGLSHAPNEGAAIASVLGAGIGGALAGIMLTVTKRLWLPIFFHTGWNLTQTLFGTGLSGMREFVPFAFIEGRMRGPDILTGGAFGLENSVLAIALTLILFILLYAWARRRVLLIALHPKAGIDEG